MLVRRSRSSSASPHKEVCPFQSLVANDNSNLFLNLGRIVNNGSLAAYSPRPHALPYTVSKHAVSGLTKQIALEGRTCGVTVTQIDIGNAHTAMAGPHTSGALQADGTVRPEPTFDVKYVGDAIVHVAGLPLDVSVPELTIM